MCHVAEEKRQHLSAVDVVRHLWECLYHTYEAFEGAIDARQDRHHLPNTFCSSIRRVHSLETLKEANTTSKHEARKIDLTNKVV
ncbi:hypothetical protein DQ04_08121040 [Trypanosoma grayi]|uniref:hypothetical protein n=1 Tax=Trypanosoma grayi TaxID=71804 RepID=UPI0004F43BC5|nr:hypothetical protein DQ04_08121040 [Trypanosoma grayi]KEG08057.1 hypothetical protein DQ04_08121040 [Trypanosoma grayi]